MSASDVPNIISSLEVWLCQNIGEENEMKANKAFWNGIFQAAADFKMNRQSELGGKQELKENFFQSVTPS